MKGTVNRLINELIDKKANGVVGLANITKTKILLKGVDYRKYDDTTPDDLEVIAKVKIIAQEMGVSL